MNIDEHYKGIAAELAKAIQKHPHFADYFADPKELNAEGRKAAKIEFQYMEKEQKKYNDSCERQNISTAFSILTEEIYEAFSAGLAGDVDHAKQEFYQVCAVCLRCIEELKETTANANSK